MARYTNDSPMTGISEEDYETMLTHLTEQLGAAFIAQGNSTVETAEANGWAGDALANAWQPEITPRAWLMAAGKRLGVDVSRCTGV